VSLDQIRAAIDPLRQVLLQHPIYGDIGNPAALRTFMEHHVFAVWDFMSLLKALQQRVCCVSVPWLPPADFAAARLVNEIVLGEESDTDGRAGFASHFDLYHRSMRGFGASTARIDRVLELLRDGRAVSSALQLAEVGKPVERFVGHTFEVIATNDLCRMASAFTFGREDLLPDVFQKIIDRLDEQTAGGLSEFKYYLLRHVELDGDEHGPMASKLIVNLCGQDRARWSAATETAVAALQARIEFWDAIHAALDGGGSA
jgi:hypothetical protein